MQITTDVVEGIKSSTFDFTYLLEKIAQAEFLQHPFRHIEISNFFSDEHFHAITTSPQVSLTKADTTKELIDTLFYQGYEVIPFPGCTVSVQDYLHWLKNHSGYENIRTCEGFGLTFRLQHFQNPILAALDKFFKSADFKAALERKFDIVRPTSTDMGLQKYLHGYEISPHPDIRKKALTYMLNVNPCSNSEDLDIHTHYLTFKPEKRFIGEFWRYNEAYDRCWLPWEWCETVKRQSQNNSIVIFAPSWDTLHGIKLNYDHLVSQRTQFYGNLWYQDIPFSPTMPQYYQFDFELQPKPLIRTRKSALKSYVNQVTSHAKKIVPQPLKRLIKQVIRR